MTNDIKQLSAAAVEASPIYKTIMQVVRENENFDNCLAALDEIGLKDYTLEADVWIGEIHLMTQENEIRIQVADGWGRNNCAPAVVLTFEQYVAACNKYR